MSNMLEKKKKLSVAIETHGCKLNFSDSEKLAAEFRELGYEIVSDDAAAESAIEAMHEKEMDGRALVVNEAKPPKPRDEF